MTENGEIVCLIKPQFEAGREKVGKKGVVRDCNVHKEVIRMVMEYAASIGFCVCNLDFSPIKGPEGNIEYLLHLSRDKSRVPADVDVEKVVAVSHEALDK